MNAEGFVNTQTNAYNHGWAYQSTRKWKKSILSKNNKLMLKKLYKHVWNTGPGVCVNFHTHPAILTNFMRISFFPVSWVPRPQQTINDFLWAEHTNRPENEKTILSKNNKLMLTKLYKHVWNTSPDICVNFQTHPAILTKFMGISIFSVS